jgi:hypothetical protein
VKELGDSAGRYVSPYTSQESMGRSTTSSERSNGWREPTGSTTRISSSSLASLPSRACAPMRNSASWWSESVDAAWPPTDPSGCRAAAWAIAAGPRRRARRCYSARARRAPRLPHGCLQPAAPHAAAALCGKRHCSRPRLRPVARPARKHSSPAALVLSLATRDAVAKQCSSPASPQWPHD